jgi:hypothetical protein
MKEGFKPFFFLSKPERRERWKVQSEMRRRCGEWFTRAETEEMEEEGK